METHDEAAEAFGTFLLSQRKLANISQRQLARMSGVSDSYLSQVERGKYRPSAEVLQSLAHAFGLPSSQMYAQFGLLDEEPDERNAVSVETAIQRDERLSADQKSALLSVYRLFVEPVA
jgi:transcriptional regulator with XRE-family HTH domain